MTLEAGRWIEQGLNADGDHERIAPFEAIELDVGRLFPPERMAHAPSRSILAR